MLSSESAKVGHPTVHNFQNLEARVFGRLTVLHYVGNASWLTRCECGNEKIVPTKQLLRSQTQSCGCLMIDRTKEANTRHGKNGTRVYRIWSGMLTRCRNLNSKDYPKYGGRGIKVCDRWLSFEAFYSDMGDPTDTQTIERKDNDGNYEPGNCLWLESSLQANNRRNSVYVVHNGVRMTATQYDRELGLVSGTTARRIRRAKERLADKILANYPKAEKSIGHKHLIATINAGTKKSPDKRGIFIVNNEGQSLDRTAYREMSQEAKNEGLSSKMHIYGRIATYTGPGVDFVSLHEAGLISLDTTESKE